MHTEETSLRLDAEAAAVRTRNAKHRVNYSTTKSIIKEREGVLTRALSFFVFFNLALKFSVRG